MGRIIFIYSILRKMLKALFYRKVREEGAKHAELINCCLALCELCENLGALCG